MELILNSGVKIKFDEFIDSWIALLQSDLDGLSFHTKCVVDNYICFPGQRECLKTLTHALAMEQSVELTIFIKVDGIIRTFSEYHKTKLAALNRAKSLNKRYKSCQDIL